MNRMNWWVCLGFGLLVALTITIAMIFRHWGDSWIEVMIRTTTVVTALILSTSCVVVATNLTWSVKNIGLDVFFVLYAVGLVIADWGLIDDLRYGHEMHKHKRQEGDD